MPREGDRSDEGCENHEMLLCDQCVGYFLTHWPGIRRYFHILWLGIRRY